MGIINLGQSDQVFEEDGSGNIIANVDVVNTDDLDINTADFVESGDFAAIGPVTQLRFGGSTFSTTSTSYVTASQSTFLVTWDTFRQTGADTAIYTEALFGGQGAKDIRLRNLTDGETIFEITGQSGGTSVSRIDTYTPTTTASQIEIEIEMRTGGGSGTMAEGVVNTGVQL